MEYRPLGRSGLAVSAIGFGAWGIGGNLWVGADDGESVRALHRAIDLGVNLVDTALAYGEGHSERLVGRVVRERKETVHVATKVPPKNRAWPATRDVPVSETFPPHYVVECCERSLKNLGVDRIDLLQLHVWHDAYLEQDGWRGALEKLKSTGKVRLVGASVSEHDTDSAMQAVEADVFDAFQVLVNVFEQRPAERFLPACEEYGVGVLARVPFDEGGLTGAVTPDTTFPAGDFRNRYFQGDRKREVQARVQRLRTLLGEEARTLPELALRYCLSLPAVSTVIPGMRRTAHVEANVPAGDGRALSASLLKSLEAHAWPRNFYH
ncbi:MAG TPA: aldo/keto reductase [Vicinamibacteria bacterium]|nr:aldo/keto reductase [Vicinamibacteria bacterium]